MEAQAAKPANPLGRDSIYKLMLKYSIPSVISMLVTALYNILDQVLIGWKVGALGNGATTIAFPLLTVGLALALLTGHGASAFISLELGRGRGEAAKKIFGNAFVMLIVFSALVTSVTLLFLEPILKMLGATDALMPYSLEYARIIMLGMPFSIISVACSHIMRADGSPRYSMFCLLSGAVLNTILSPIFIFTLNMGITGAALTTITGQGLSFSVAIYYLLRKAKYVRISLSDLKPRFDIMKKIAGYGSSSFVNQMSMFFVQIILNRSLAYYGAMTHYGPEIPIAAVGIIMKINMILLSVILGTSIGLQPILGFNYGAGNYRRVKQAFLTGVSITGILALIMNILFLTIPGAFIALFGKQDALFSEFAAHALRTFMCCVFTAGIQIPSSMYFMAVGKPLKSMLLNMTRQVLILIPMVVILPLKFGLDGVLYAPPAADILATLVTSFFILKELRGLAAGRECPCGG